jgi:hypothetical protein
LQVGDTGPVESARRSNSRVLGSPFSGLSGQVGSGQPFISLSQAFCIRLWVCSLNGGYIMYRSTKAADVRCRGARLSPIRKNLFHIQLSISTSFLNICRKKFLPHRIQLPPYRTSCSVFTLLNKTISHVLIKLYCLSIKRIIIAGLIWSPSNPAVWTPAVERGRLVPYVGSKMI